MENQENNNLSELDQLKAQYETLKEQFDQQEIVNDRLMKSSIKHSVDFYKRYRWLQVILYPLVALLGLLLIQRDFSGNLSAKLLWVTYCLVCLAIELLLTRKLQLKTLENGDLLTLSNHASSFKRLFSLFLILCYSTMMIIVCGWLLWWIGSGVANLRVALLLIGIVIMTVVIVGIYEVRYKTRPCDEIIQKIEALGKPIERKTGFDKRQKWFCIAMIVAFIGLDAWAYTIVASRLKLPPMWRTVEYVRAVDDFSTEGKLEFWEVYADTLVAEEDVATVMDGWNVCDSLAVMKSKESSFEIGLDKESYHVWKNEDDSGHQMRLYALKKTTPEGPAISSAVLHGKPMVAYVTCTYPRNFSDTEPMPIFVFLTPEARQLWYRFITQIAGHRTAIVMDGVVIQDWQVMCGIDNGKFLISKEWSSKEELKDFCNCLIKQ